MQLHAGDDAGPSTEQDITALIEGEDVEVNFDDDLDSLYDTEDGTQTMPPTVDTRPIVYTARILRFLTNLQLPI